MDQTRISLIWPFLCCISIYWSFILMFGDALKKKSGCLNNEWLSGWPFFSFMSFIDCHIHFFTRVDHGSCCTAMAKKTFEHVILNNYVQTSSPRLSFREGQIVKLWKPCRGPHSFNSSFNSTSSAYFLTILKQSHLWHLHLYWTSYNMIWEFLNTGLCKYFKYLNFENGTWTWTT